MIAAVIIHFLAAHAQSASEGTAQARTLINEAEGLLRERRVDAAFERLDAAKQKLGGLSEWTVCRLFGKLRLCDDGSLQAVACYLHAEALYFPPADLDGALSELHRARAILETAQLARLHEKRLVQLAALEGRIHHRRREWGGTLVALGRIGLPLLRADGEWMQMVCDAQLNAVNGSESDRSHEVDHWLGVRLERIACSNRSPCRSKRMHGAWCAEAMLQECHLDEARKE
jgi:hypothetical protein